MITSLTSSYNVEDSDVGYVIGDYKTINPGDVIPVFIPKLMSSIPRSDTKETNLIGIDSATYIFSNSPSCIPRTRTLLKSCNYINAKALSNCDYTGGLKNNQKVSILFANDSLREIYFNTDIKEK